MEIFDFVVFILVCSAIFAGGFVAVSYQTSLRNYISRKKVLALDNLSELYLKATPPRNLITEEGKKKFFVLSLRNYVSREKVAQLEDMKDLYYYGEIPPRKILTDEGQRKYDWLRRGAWMITGGFVFLLFWFGE